MRFPQLRTRFLAGMAVASIVAFQTTNPQIARASDHQDSALMVSRPGADLTDVFVFPSSDPTKVVLAMDVHPLIPQGMYDDVSFDPAVMYQFKINTRDGWKENKVIQFGVEGVGASQTVKYYGPASPSAPGTVSTWVGDPVSFGFNTTKKLSDGTKIFAGPRKDPFYFDLAQFFKILPDRDASKHPNVPAPSAMCFQKHGVDYLRDFDVLSFVVELPRKELADPNGRLGLIRMYATTSIQENGQWVQVERLARPAVKEATESFDQHDETNRSSPWNDTTLKNSVYSFMVNGAHRSPRLAHAVTGVLIPDEIEANLHAHGPARYLAVETQGKSGLPTAVVRVVPTIPLGGIKKAIGDPYREFGGRDPSSPVIDLSLGVIFGTLGQKVGLAPNDGKGTPCLTSDNVHAGSRGVTKSFPYIGQPI